MCCAVHERVSVSSNLVFIQPPLAAMLSSRRPYNRCHVIRLSSPRMLQPCCSAPAIRCFIISIWLPAFRRSDTWPGYSFTCYELMTWPRFIFWCVAGVVDWIRCLMKTHATNGKTVRGRWANALLIDIDTIILSPF